MFGLTKLFRRKPHLKEALALYGATVRAARRPAFYGHWGVPDTPEGRFEMLALHAFLILKRLKAAPGAGALAQTFFDEMFRDMDENLRELGVSDVTIGKKVKALVTSFYGRIAVYESALAEQGPALAETLARFPYAGNAPDAAALDALAAHVRAQDRHLAMQADEWLLAGTVTFRNPERPSAGTTGQSEEATQS